MTYDQLIAFVSIIDAGGFKAASRMLNISQPSISVAVKKLEEEFGISLFSREAYRPQITPAGQAFYEMALVAIRQMRKLEELGNHLGSGQESEIAIALTDACPTEFTVALLKGFFLNHQSTKLKLQIEGVRGAVERVLLDEAELGIAPVLDAVEGIDYFPLGSVRLIPVCSPDYPLAQTDRPFGEIDLREYVQVILKDTSTQFDNQSFGVVKGASSSCTVNDKHSKKLIIREGLGWGSLPDHMVVNELRTGKLVEINWLSSKYPTMTINAIRKESKPLGPVAEKLWNFLKQKCEKKSIFNVLRV